MRAHSTMTDSIAARLIDDAAFLQQHTNGTTEVVQRSILKLLIENLSRKNQNFKNKQAKLSILKYYVIFFNLKIV